MNKNFKIEARKKIFFIKNLFKDLKKQNSFPEIWCIVLHPVEYQIPFYQCLYKKSNNNSFILFMDNFTIRTYMTSKWGKDRSLKVREANKPENYNFLYKFLGAHRAPWGPQGSNKNS